MICFNRIQVQVCAGIEYSPGNTVRYSTCIQYIQTCTGVHYQLRTVLYCYCIHAVDYSTAQYSKFTIQIPVSYRYSIDSGLCCE